MRRVQYLVKTGSKPAAIFEAIRQAIRKVNFNYEIYK